MLLADIAKRIDTEATYLNRTSRNLALKALVFVNAYVSPELYGAVTGPKPVGTEQVLATQAGLCGAKCQVFCDVLRFNGVACRQVGFEFPDDQTHVGAEARIDGRWRYFDVTWGAYWEENGEILTFDEIFAGRGQRVANEPCLASSSVVQHGGDPWRYLTDFTRRWVLTRDAPGGEVWA